MQLIRILLLACAGFMASHAGAQTSLATVTIGAEDDWYPYSGVVKGEVKGLGVDLVRASFARRGVDVKFIALPYKRCLDMTRRGELLACTQPARNPETESDFLWPNLPLLHAVSRIYARSPSEVRGLSTADLEGRPVIVTNGFEYGAEFDGNRTVKRMTATKEVLVFRMLLAKRADLAIAYEKTAEHLFHQFPDELHGRFEAVGVIASVPQYLAFSKQHKDTPVMLPLFNEGFHDIKASGELHRIEVHWSTGAP